MASKEKAIEAAGAASALKEIFDDILSVTPDDVDEVIDELKQRGFLIMRARLTADLERKLAVAVDALEPFSAFAGELFARNWNVSDIVSALDNSDDPHRVTAGDYFRARTAIASIKGE